MQGIRVTETRPVPADSTLLTVKLLLINIVVQSANVTEITTELHIAFLASLPNLHKVMGRHCLHKKNKFSSADKTLIFD